MSASSAQPPACRQARIEELTRTAISMTYVSWPHRFVQPVAKLHKQAHFCRSLIRSRRRLAEPSHPSTHSSSLTVTPTTLSETSHPSCPSDSRGFGGFFGHQQVIVCSPKRLRTSNREWANYGSRTRTAKIRFPQRRAAEESSARAGRAEVLLNLCERDHHHHWIDRTLVKSGTCIEALRVV